ncbi:MAG: hypothetical protein ABI846_06965 [Rudaea sp.]
MQALIAIVLLVSWSCLGGAILCGINALDRTSKVLLAPVTGIALATVVIATASFAGLPIGNSVWLVVAAVPIAAFVLARRGFGAVGELASVFGVLLLANLASAGLGVLLYGSTWQGFVNGDAAVNALGAQYFIAHAFYSTPSLADAVQGTDYTSTAILLNVAGGQRFGDVMLLGLSARAFDLAPDQVYMAHAFALRCALLAASAMLVHSAGRSRGRTVFVLLVLSLCPLLTYAYTNELISQIGGMAIAFALIALCDKFLRAPNHSRPLLLPTALLAAALCETYPECVPYFGLCMGMLVGHYWLFARLPGWRSLAGFALPLLLMVLVIVNVSLPSIIYSVTNILAWGGLVEGRDAVAVNLDFAYAFIPDFFPLLVGFEGLREGLREPAVTLTIVGGAVALIAIVWFSLRRHRTYPLVATCLLATSVVFGLFFYRDNGFGSFKVMILAQPILFCAAAEMVAIAYARRAIGYLVAAAAATLAAARGDFSYIYRSVSHFSEIAHMADGDVLGEIQALRAASPNGIVLDPSNYLLRRFGLLRPGGRPLKSSESFSAYTTTQNFLEQVARNPFSRWLPQKVEATDQLLAFYQHGYVKNAFTCAAPMTPVSFEMLVDEPAGGHRETVISGPTSVPLNALGGSPRAAMVSVGSFPAGAALVFRASSAGSFYGAKSVGFVGPVSLYSTEHDFALPSIVAATGRYAMFQLLAPPEGPIRLSLSYSRSPLGGADSKLDGVTIYGSDKVSVTPTGGGAFHTTSPPFSPCVVAGKSYFIVDFGADPHYFTKVQPLLYRLMGLQYLPDIRKVSGYLRDLSVVPAKMSADVPAVRASSPSRWTFADFDAQFEYSGMYEDGWMSDTLTLRPLGFSSAARMTLEFDVSMEGATSEPTLSASIDGKVVSRQRLSAGANRISIDLPAGIKSTVVLAVDKPLRLPGFDGRSVLGYLKALSVE